ncbi:GTPase [Alienimonas sp. DA493]|uniref:GTPase n=1 Tax=Alienimonas sp. DA493 TaxID=3373605 RepID=UPI003755305C
MADLAEFAAAARRLAEAVAELDRQADGLELTPAAKRPWHETLHGKLLPQLPGPGGGGAFLVVAVVGGTNIGKSLIFNHLAGFPASSSSKFASGTKHPTCLAPAGFSQSHRLEDIFPGFVPTKIDEQDPDAALRADDRDLLFWAESDAVPDNLLLLDTPDVDADAPVNWERAAKIRTAADVLLAVVTEQKYNDAAVVRFFREAGGKEVHGADAAVVVVFNQVHLPEDDQYWPSWVGTFAERTGIDPDLLFLAPHDRDAAKDLRLPFHPRPWPPGESEPEAQARGTAGGESLRTALSELHFDEVKLRTLSGAVDRLASPEDGVSAWLAEVREAAARFAAAGEHLMDELTDSKAKWPPVPAAALVEEVRDWWRGRRTGATRRVADAYTVVGGLIAQPFRALRGPKPPPLEGYAKEELALFRRAVERLFGQLERLRESDPILAPRLAATLGGASRADLLERLRTDHAACDLEGELAAVVRTEMDALLTNNPRAGRWLRVLDGAAVMGRPALTVGLLGTGVIGTELAAAGVTVVADTLVGGAAAAAGEAAGAGAGSLAMRVNAKLARIERRFADRRRAWLERWVRDALLGPLVSDVAHAAALPDSEAFAAVGEALSELQRASGGRAPAAEASRTPERTGG